MRVLLVVYDNDSYIHWFPMGTAYIASALRNAGHHVFIYSQDQHHYPEPQLTDYLCENHFDVVAVGVIGGYYQYRKLLALSRAIHAVPERPRFVIGGAGPSPEPEFFLRKTGADVAVIGEGEVTMVELLDAFNRTRDLDSVNGIAYIADNRLRQTSERQPIPEVDAIPHPAWDLFPMDYYALLRMPHATNSDRVLPVLAGRGCPYKCNFCYRIDKGVRLRSPRSIVEEIRLLKIRYGATYIAFMDDLLMYSASRMRHLCQTLIDADLRIKWCGNGRLNIVTPELLELMKASGCVFINYGIEAMDDQVLHNMHKELTCQQIITGIEATLAAGISPGYNIIFGNFGDTPETLQKGVDFLLKYDDHAQLRTIRPVTPYPGSELYTYAIEHGLLKGPEDFYEEKHVNSDLLSVNFTDLPDDEVHRLLFEANKTLLENYFTHQTRVQIATAEQLYLQRDASFRGFRQT
jgi:radical SAM superfamily enzyme YgiQ (UPF0313 family)